jgi:hypothetical protein
MVSIVVGFVPSYFTAWTIRDNESAVGRILPKKIGLLIRLVSFTA